MGSLPSRGIHDENASSVRQMPMAPTQVLPEMLPPVPTFTPSITGPRQIVTAGMAPVAGGVTLLPLDSFRTCESTPRIEPLILTQGLFMATHTVPSVPTSLVAPPKSKQVTPDWVM